MRIGRKKALILIIGSIASVVIIILSLFLMTGQQSLPPLPPDHGHFDIEMEYVGKNADGNLVVRVAELYRRYHDLSEVKVYIFNVSGEKINFSENGITLLEAKQNYQNPQYDGNISYIDKDSNGKVTIGDEIIIKSVENEGVGNSKTGEQGYLKLWAEGQGDISLAGFW